MGSLNKLSHPLNQSFFKVANLVKGLDEIVGATRAIEGNAYWIALVVSWMQTLGSQPSMPKSPRLDA
jgi:hypothetical protein